MYRRITVIIVLWWVIVCVIVDCTIKYHVDNNICFQELIDGCWGFWMLVCAREGRESRTRSTPVSTAMLTSSEWRSDGTRARCTSCHINFHDLFNRRHHCRLCGDVFCDKCTHRRALIPPSAIVLKHTK